MRVSSSFFRKRTYSINRGHFLCAREGAQKTECWEGGRCGEGGRVMDKEGVEGKGKRERESERAGERVCVVWMWV